MSKQDKKHLILCIGLLTLWALSETIVNTLAF